MAVCTTAYHRVATHNVSCVTDTDDGRLPALLTACPSSRGPSVTLFECEPDPADPALLSLERAAGGIACGPLTRLASLPACTMTLSTNCNVSSWPRSSSNSKMRETLWETENTF